MPSPPVGYGMRVSVLIGSRNRPNVLKHCLHSVIAQDCRGLCEILVLDDASDECYAEQYASCAQLDPRILCLRSDVQGGVAGGRNCLMGHATGELLAFIDDDAVFGDDSCLTRAVSKFEGRPQIGIISGRIIDHREGEKGLLVPFSQNARKANPLVPETEQLVSYFLGGWHIIRRSVIDQCGKYDPLLVFGEEEVELSYRAINAGFQILYCPTAVVHHYPQSSVLEHRDRPSMSELYCHMRNRLLIAYKYLPWRYVPTYLGVWLTVYAGMAFKQGSPSDFVSGVAHVIVALRSVRRIPLNRSALSYLRSHYGRLWY